MIEIEFVPETPEVSSEPSPGIVVIVPSIEESEKEFGKTVSLSSVLGQWFPHQKLHALSRENVTIPATKGSRSLLIQTIHHCYNQHFPLGLRPEVLWYAIVSEIAIHTKLNPKECAHLFTFKPDQVQTVRVRDDSLVLGSPDNNWGRTIQLFEEAMREFLPPQTLGIFVPDFSTQTQESRVATMVSFMDAASPFFEYRVSTLCGIPRIRLHGSVQDWALILENTRTLSQQVPGLESWFENLLPVLGKLKATAEGERDLDFWKSIYKVSGGSGGPHITGWITAFSAYVNNYKDQVVKKHEQWWDWKQLMAYHGGFSTTSFMTHRSSVDVIWEYHAQEYPLNFVAGIFSAEPDDQGFYTPSLGWGVVELDREKLDSMKRAPKKGDPGYSDW